MNAKQNKTITYLQNILDGDTSNINDKLSYILADYKKNSAILQKAIKQNDTQSLQLKRLHEKLDENKKCLEKKVETEIEKRHEKERMLLQQSRLASMGEMMDAVAHQWKQPISSISMQVEMIGHDFEDKLINQNYIDNFQEQVQNQIKYMTSTLHEFRNFFRASKNIENFNVKEMIEKVILLTKDEFIQHTIEIVLDVQDSFTLSGIENEFKHLIINIINNSKDAFIQNDIKNRKIQITLRQEKKYKIIEITDNAGGIANHILKDIFKANTTTKESLNGTGIGLYMSSQIAQKYHGELSVTNTQDGAKFIFRHKELA